MPFLTNEEIERRKAAGIKMNRLNCGWNISNSTLTKIADFIDKWEPKTEAEKRDKHILELAFIENMNASQIARLNDPIIVGVGNRSKGKPLSPTSIVAICHKYAPDLKKKKDYTRQDRAKRNELFLDQQQRKIIKPRICSTCGSVHRLELHHIIPLSAGGTNDYYNLIYLCHDCHMKLHHTIYDSLKISSSIIFD